MRCVRLKFVWKVGLQPGAGGFVSLKMADWPLRCLAKKSLRTPFRKWLLSNCLLNASGPKHQRIRDRRTTFKSFGRL